MHQAVGPSVVALREWYPQFKPKSTDACALDFDHSLHTTPCGGGSNTSTANSTSTTTSTLYRYRYRYRWWIPCRGRDRRHAIQAYIIYIMIDDILILMYIYIYILFPLMRTSLCICTCIYTWYQVFTLSFVCLKEPKSIILVPHRAVPWPQSWQEKLIRVTAIDGVLVDGDWWKKGSVNGYHISCTHRYTSTYVYI